MVVKSCLKQNVAPPSATDPEPPSYEGPLLPSDIEQPKPLREARRKSVTFSEDGNAEVVKEEVFYVEEYDRTPMKVTNRLNYRDMLELMELRLSLPRIRAFGRRQRSSSVDSEGSTS
ncbi:uncharacterized protein B0H18DRAFT_951998 [Fomitopsis serialis]|uniref:uncharacterized protein n=1 Tax=Fomitopsis serialis TaxID=139415 RepID=UPI002007BF76|nr:uncharacterized protein B0H18DRAFT_951998 [Neoantrodia serialis]KAH9933464.1 hypothetical protein B0H18DRAFT_951998 [Neoantrodia serialis]